MAVRVRDVITENIIVAGAQTMYAPAIYILPAVPGHRLFHAEHSDGVYLCCAAGGEERGGDSNHEQCRGS